MGNCFILFKQKKNSGTNQYEIFIFNLSNYIDLYRLNLNLDSIIKPGLLNYFLDNNEEYCENGESGIFLHFEEYKIELEKKELEKKLNKNYKEMSHLNKI